MNLWVAPVDGVHLHAAPAVCLLVGGPSGSGRSGTLARMAALAGALTAVPDLTVAAMLPLGNQGERAEARRTLPGVTLIWRNDDAAPGRQRLVRLEQPMTRRVDVIVVDAGVDAASEHIAELSAWLALARPDGIVPTPLVAADALAGVGTRRSELTAATAEAALARVVLTIQRSVLDDVRARYAATLDELRVALCQVADLQDDYEHAMRILESVPKPVANTSIDYGWVVERMRSLVARNIPPGSTIAVVSRGDPDLVNLDLVKGTHFPQTVGGAYAGHHPSSFDDIVVHLETVRQRGAKYLMFPVTTLWWLDYYRGLDDLLTDIGEEVVNDPAGRIFALGADAAADARAALATTLAKEMYDLDHEIRRRKVSA